MKKRQAYIQGLKGALFSSIMTDVDEIESRYFVRVCPFIIVVTKALKNHATQKRKSDIRIFRSLVEEAESHAVISAQDQLVCVHDKAGCPDHRCALVAQKGCDTSNISSYPGV